MIVVLDVSKGIFENATQEEFTNAMRDAASVIVNYFKGKVKLYILIF